MTTAYTKDGSASFPRVVYTDWNNTGYRLPANAEREREYAVRYIDGSEDRVSEYAWWSSNSGIGFRLCRTAD